MGHGGKMVNKEARRLASRQWKARHRVENAASKKRWAAANAEKVKAARKRWRERRRKRAADPFGA
jgi:hypothetical protein